MQDQEARSREQLLEQSFGRVPDQTTVANAMAEHGNVRPSTGWKGIVHRLASCPEQHPAQQR